MNDRNTPQHGNLRYQRVFPLVQDPLSSGRVARCAAPWVLGLLVAGPASAADLHTDPFLHGNATTVGLAGVSRASTRNLDNVLHGSAVLALESRYDVDVNGYLEPSGWKGFDIAALDSRTSSFALGVRYSWARHADLPLLDNELPGWELTDSTQTNVAVAQHIAVGMAIAPDPARFWSIGLHGGWFWRTTARAGDGSGVRLGASVAARPIEDLSLSLGGTVPFLVEAERGFEAQPRLDGGVRWQFHEQAGLMADVALPLDQVDGVDFGVGSEWFVADVVPVRVGYSRQAGEVRNNLGAGLGIVSEYLNLQYGIWFDLGPDAQGLELPRHALTIAIWM